MVAAVGKESLAPFQVPAKGGASDFEMREFRLEVFRRRLVEAEELLRRAAPAARVARRFAIRWVEVRFVPDFPVFDAELVRPLDVLRRPALVHTPAPALVVVADDMLADTGPLGEVLRRQDAVFLRPMLNRLAKAEEDMRPCPADVVEVVVCEDEVVVAGVVLVGVEVGEYGRNVAGVGAAGDAVDGVVGAGEWDSRRLVFIKVAANLVAAGILHGGAVVHRVHGLDGADRIGGIDGDDHSARPACACGLSRKRKRGKGWRRMRRGGVRSRVKTGCAAHGELEGQRAEERRTREDMPSAHGGLPTLIQRQAETEAPADFGPIGLCVVASGRPEQR